MIAVARKRAPVSSSSSKKAPKTISARTRVTFGGGSPGAPDSPATSDAGKVRRTIPWHH